MGVRYNIEKSIVVITNSGLFTCQDVERTLLKLTVDKNYRTSKRILFIDNGSDYNPSSDEPEVVARMLGSFVPKISNSIGIVVKTDLHYGLARMIQVYCKQHDVTIGVFRDEQVARFTLCEDLLADSECTEHYPAPEQ